MSIKQFLPKPNDTALYQSHIDQELYKKLRERLKRQKVTQRSFTEAAIRQFLQEK